MKILIAYLLLIIVSLSCNENSQSRNYGVEEAKETLSSFDIVRDKKVVDGKSHSSPNDTKIIREASLHYETQNLKGTYEQILAAVKKHKAYIQSDSEGKDYNSLFRNIIVRIPNDNFDEFITDIEKNVAYFDRKQISARDITSEYIDLEARLKAKKILEERYLLLLNKASKVLELLEIERELSVIREEIEAKEGQLKYLQNKISLSTITLEFYKTVANTESATVSYGTKMWKALQSGWNGISSFFIGLLHIWPFILILVAVFMFFRKKLKRKNN